MKRLIRFASSMMLIAVLVFTIDLSALANSTVIYNGKNQEFEFHSEGGYTSSDLFDGFKNVMPGDTLTEIITVKNDSSNSDYVNFYLRAVAHDDTGNPPVVDSNETSVTMSDFLAQLHMTVIHNGEVIYASTPNDAGALSENVLLGKFKSGDAVELQVDLSVPIELGNEYANRVGEVDWVFVAEELDKETEATPDSNVKTGDTANILLWAGIMGITLLIMTVVIIYKRKMK